MSKIYTVDWHHDTSSNLPFWDKMRGTVEMQGKQTRIDENIKDA